MQGESNREMVLLATLVLAIGLFAYYAMPPLITHLRVIGGMIMLMYYAMIIYFYIQLTK